MVGRDMFTIINTDTNTGTTMTYQEIKSLIKAKGVNLDTIPAWLLPDVVAEILFTVKGCDPEDLDKADRLFTTAEFIATRLLEEGS